MDEGVVAALIFVAILIVAMLIYGAYTEPKERIKAQQEAQAKKEARAKRVAERNAEISKLTAAEAKQKCLDLMDETIEIAKDIAKIERENRLAEEEKKKRDDYFRNLSGGCMFF